MIASILTNEIRAILGAHARLVPPIATLEDDADLFTAGMTSHASVDVMLAIEGALHIEFPDRMLHRSVFASVSSIRRAILELEACRRARAEGDARARAHSGHE